MEKKILQTCYISSMHIGIGPSKFARYDGEMAHIDGYYGQSGYGTDVMGGSVQDAYDVTVEYANISNGRNQKPKCFGGCSSTTDENDWLSELHSAVKSGKSIHEVSTQVSENVVFASLEFFKGKTTFHVKYNATADGKWENGGKDITEYFDKNLPGGDRVDRYERLKRDMQGDVKIGMVFSEETVWDRINYVHVFVKNGGIIDEYIVQVQNTPEEFSKLYSSFANNEVVADFATPLYFSHDVPLEAFVEKIEQSYLSEDSRNQAAEYLGQLKHDMNDLPNIDSHQEEAKALAEYIQQQLWTNGMSHAVLSLLAGNLEAFMQGDLTIDTLPEVSTSNVSELRTVSEIFHYVEDATWAFVENGDRDTHKQNLSLIFEILDGVHGDTLLTILTSESTDDEWIQTMVSELGITHDSAVEIITTLSTLDLVYKDHQQIIDVVTEAKVGYGALFFALDVIAISDIPEYNIVTTDFTAEDRAAISEYASRSGRMVETTVLDSIVQLPQQEKEALFSLLLQPDLKDKIIEIQNNLPDEVDIDLLIQSMLFIQKIDILPADKKESAIIVEKEKTLIKISVVWEHFMEMVRHDGESVTIHNPHELLPRPDSDEQVNNFSEALMIWMLIQLTGYYSNLELLHETVLQKGENSLVKLITKEKPERLLQKEPAPWLLLSIIWQLAMIREQGMAQSQTQQQNTNPPMPQNVTLVDDYFPDYGIIFAFHS